MEISFDALVLNLIVYLSIFKSVKLGVPLLRTMHTILQIDLSSLRTLCQIDDVLSGVMIQVG
jgi:hypothetical protein